MIDGCGDGPKSILANWIRSAIDVHLADSISQPASQSVWVRAKKNEILWSWMNTRKFGHHDRHSTAGIPSITVVIVVFIFEWIFGDLDFIQCHGIQCQWRWCWLVNWNKSVSNWSVSWRGGIVIKHFFYTIGPGMALSWSKRVDTTAIDGWLLNPERFIHSSHQSLAFFYSHLPSS